MLVRTRKTVPSVLGYCHLSGAFRALTSEGGKVKGKGSLRVRGDGGWILTLVIFRLQFLLIIISRQKKLHISLSALLLSSEKDYRGQALAWKATLNISVVLGAGHGPKIRRHWVHRLSMCPLGLFKPHGLREPRDLGVCIPLSRVSAFLLVL